MFAVVIFALLMSGSIFASVFLHKKFEEFLPITCMGIVTILYIFGLFGILNVGFYVVLIISALLIMGAIINLFLLKDFKEFLTHFFTPTFFIFALIFLVIYACNRNKLAASWDEFSHWADSVKAMWLADDFVTNPEAHSAFQSYPPAMSLFQYFFQKLIELLELSSSFVESKVYVAYQIFSLSIFFPFLKDEKKRILKIVATGAILFVLPSVFFNDFFNMVYIDPFISILAGCGFSRILLEKNKDLTYQIYMSLLCFILVLSKDVGFLFAVFVGVCYLLSAVSEGFRKINFWQKIMYILEASLPLISAFMAKMTWKLELQTSGAKIAFGSQIDVWYYTKMFFTKCDTTYYQKVVENFKNAFFEQTINLNNIGIHLSYFNLTVIIFAIAAAMIWIIQNRNCSKEEKRVKTVVIGCTVGLLCIYVYCLGATYVSNFSEYEAIVLASYARYMNIAYAATILVIVLFFLENLTDLFKSERASLAILLATVLMISPTQNIKRFLNGDYVRDSAEVRKQYQEMVNEINTYCEENSNIYFISQEDSGFHYWVTRYSVRPHLIDGGWSIGEPFYDGDIWTKTKTAEEWKKVLTDNNYDYVALYKINDYFSENFGQLFENPAEIENNSLFKLNVKTQLLERVDL